MRSTGTGHRRRLRGARGCGVAGLQRWGWTPSTQHGGARAPGSRPGAGSGGVGLGNEAGGGGPGSRGRTARCSQPPSTLSSVPYLDWSGCVPLLSRSSRAQRAQPMTAFFVLVPLNSVSAPDCVIVTTVLFAGPLGSVRPGRPLQLPCYLAAALFLLDQLTQRARVLARYQSAVAV